MAGLPTSCCAILVSSTTRSAIEREWSWRRYGRGFRITFVGSGRTSLSGSFPPRLTTGKSNWRGRASRSICRVQGYREGSRRIRHTAAEACRPRGFFDCDARLNSEQGRVSEYHRSLHRYAAAAGQTAVEHHISRFAERGAQDDGGSANAPRRSWRFARKDVAPAQVAGIAEHQGDVRVGQYAGPGSGSIRSKGSQKGDAARRQVASNRAIAV